MRKISSFMNGVFISKTKLFPQRLDSTCNQSYSSDNSSKNSNLRFWIVIYAKNSNGVFWDLHKASTEFILRKSGKTW